MSIIPDLSVIFVTTTPIWAYLLSRISYKKIWLWPLILTAITACMYVAATQFMVLKISRYTWLYLLFSIIYMIILTKKLGAHEPLKNVGYSLMLIFIAADLWELPVFVLGWLGIKYTQYFNLPYQIHHLYILLVYVLVSKLIPLQTTKKTIMIITATLFLVTIQLFTLPTWTSRLTNLVLFGYVVYEAQK